MRPMRQMFESATLKLTAWYVLILMTISIIFSFIIFEVSTNEISSSLEHLQLRLEGNASLSLPNALSLTDVRQRQTSESKVSIFFGLLYINTAVLVIGGAGGYWLARQTLRPIEEAHEAQSRFTSDASHELKTPLAAMKSEIEVTLRDPTSSQAELRQLLESNLEEVDKLSALSQALLQLSRLDYSDISRGERVNVFDMLSTAAMSLGKTDDRFELKAPKQPILVDGNKAMLQDLCTILFDNALKYSPQDSKITSTLEDNGRTCTIVIANEGEGIKPDDLAHIFDRFYRADRSRTSNATKGYGLGLSLAKKIVDFHDGQISVKSAPGGLTTFFIQLPNVQKNR